MNIAIDGFAASGKSSIAQEIAKKLNIKVFNTGEIYRGMACAYRELGLQEPTDEICADFVKRFTIKPVFEEDGQHTIVKFKSGRVVDYTSGLRSEEISALSAKISRFPLIRKKVLLVQRKFARENDCVMEGRDIATEVLPKAKFKFFVTADVNVRAQRRVAQLGNVKFEDVLEEMKVRDYSDVHRKYGKLEPAKDSHIIDTTNKTLEESTNECLKIIRSKI